MASFFRMGRQPDAFHLKFGYQGYTSSKNEAAPRLEAATLGIDWESSEDPEDVLDRLWEGQQALPFDKEGQVVVVTLTVDDAANAAIGGESGDGRGGSASTSTSTVPGHAPAHPGGGATHERTPSGSVLGSMFARGSSSNLTSFLSGGIGGSERAAYRLGPVSLALEVTDVTPKPRKLELRRVNNSGTDTMPSQLYDVMRQAKLEFIQELVLKEGTTRLLADLLPRWIALRRLDLAGSGLVAVPEEIDQLPQIEALILDNNKLAALPSLVKLRNLRELRADTNQIWSLRTDLRECTELRIISLEGNRLTKPVLDMRALAKVHTLQLFGNPIEYLPEMHHAFNLRSLSLANVRVTSDATFDAVEVSTGDGSGLISSAFGGGGARQGSKAYAPFFSLIFRHSSCQHLLIATAIARIAAEDKANCDAIASTEGAVQQLLSMVLSNDVLVVREASKTLAALAADPILAQKLVDAQALQRIQSLLGDSESAVQICGLQILSNLAFSSDYIARKLFSETLLDSLINLVREGKCRQVQIMGLEAMGNLSFEPTNRRTVARYARSLLAGYALSGSAGQSLSSVLSPKASRVGNAAFGAAAGQGVNSGSDVERSERFGSGIEAGARTAGDLPQEKPGVVLTANPGALEAEADTMVTATAKGDEVEGGDVESTMAPATATPAPAPVASTSGGGERGTCEGGEGATVGEGEGKGEGDGEGGGGGRSQEQVHYEVKRMATRALAILGENELVRQAVGRRPMVGRGVRILCMDGGGIRGSATVRMLQRLEEGSGKKIHELFDLICGTSTGGILAVAVGVHKHDLRRCDHIYKNLGTRVFSKPRQTDPGESSWRDGLHNLYTSGQQKWRVAYHGSKHDASLFETLVRQECKVVSMGMGIPPSPTSASTSTSASAAAAAAAAAAATPQENTFIDTCLMAGPKVFVVSTLISVAPAAPFLFRNYEYPEAVDKASEDRRHPPGSCRHLLWQGVRASSAAPYYLADFSLGADKWQDGAVTCNNPSMLGVMEARRLWPDRALDCVVSMGSGAVAPRQRDMSSISRIIDTGSVLMESSCSVDRVDESLRTLLPLVSGARYFRFNPVDERCAMELDDTEPGLLQGLMDATEDYIKEEDVAFTEACTMLKGATHNGGEDDEGTAAVLATEVGSRRGLLLVEAPRIEEEVSASSAAVAAFCSLRSIPFERLNTAVAVTIPAPPPTTPVHRKVAPKADASGEGGGDVGNEGQDAAGAYSKSSSKSQPRLSKPLSKQRGVGGGGDGSGGNGGGGETDGGGGSGIGVSALVKTATRFSPHMGVVHFNCLSDASGMVLRWQTDVTAVAEPSALAREFLDKVQVHVQPDGVRFASLHHLCAHYSRVEVDGVLHKMLGKHVQAGASQGEEIGAYLFRRTLPLECLDAVAGANALAGVWRDRIVVSAAGLPRALVRVLLDAGAKVVIAPCVEEDAEHAVSWEHSHGAGDFFSAFYHALYVVGADAVAALGAAVLVAPGGGHFRCHMRIAGELVTLKAGDDDLLPGDD